MVQRPSPERAASDIPGRNSITSRALERAITAVAATHLGVGAREVTVKLSDDKGLLAVAVTSPLRVPPLRSAGSSVGILGRIADARAGIRDDVTTVTGAIVGRVSVEVSRAVVVERTRVA